MDSRERLARSVRSHRRSRGARVLRRTVRCSPCASWIERFAPVPQVLLQGHQCRHHLATDQSQDPAARGERRFRSAVCVVHTLNGPVGAACARVGRRHEIILNPSDKDVEASKLTLFYAGNENRTLMIEAQAGTADEGGVPESVVASAPRAAHEARPDRAPTQAAARDRQGKAGSSAAKPRTGKV